MRNILKNMILCFLLGSSFLMSAQEKDSTNFDFSKGFSKWQRRTGRYSSGKGDTIPIFGWTNVYLTDSTISNAEEGSYCSYDIENPEKYFVIFNRANLGSNLMDVYAPALPKIPDGAEFSARIGDNCGGGKCAGLTYEYKPVVGQSDLLILKYALVSQTPGHDGTQNPTFDIKVTVLDRDPHSVNYMRYIERPELGCVSLTFTSDYRNLGKDTLLHQSPNRSDITYRDWATIGMDLSSFVDEDIRVEISSSDCSYVQHFSYAYFTGTCTAMKITTNNCPKEEGIVAEAIAPEGFKYKWYYNDGSGNPDLTKGVLGEQQKLSIPESYFHGNQRKINFVCIVSSLIGRCLSVLPVSITNFKSTISFTDSIYYSPNPSKSVDVLFTASIDTANMGSYTYNTHIESYSWDFGDGNMLSGIKNPVHQYQITSENFNVKLQAQLSYTSLFFRDTVYCTANLAKNIFIPKVGINLNTNSLCDILTLYPDSTHKLIATIFPEEYSNKNFVWESIDTDIATVDNGGIITAKSIGSTTIYVYTSDSVFKDSCHVVVKSKSISLAKEIAIRPKPIKLSTGNTASLAADINLVNANESIFWTSSNENIVIVNAKGEITALSAGSAFITAAIQNKCGDYFTDTCSVSVVSPTIIEIIVDTHSLSITINWPKENAAKTYRLILYSDFAKTQIVKTYEFNSEGKLLTKNDTYSHTITDLEPETHYYYTLDAIDEKEEKIASYAGDFTTGKTTGIEEIEKAPECFKIYPNPVTNGKIIVEILNGNSSSNDIQIFDLNGQILGTHKNTGIKTEINISHLPNGAYIIKIGKETVKVIKK